MEVQIGQIYWVRIKNEILHPHLVVENDIIVDDSRGFIKVTLITTNRKKEDLAGNVILEIGEG